MILHQQRGFGVVISDTFLFCRENIKGISQAYLAVILPTYIGLLLLLSLAGSVFDNLIGSSMDLSASLGGAAVARPVMFGVVFWVMYNVNAISIFSYMRLYDEHDKDAITVNQIWDAVRSKLLAVLIGTLVTFGLILFGSIFLVFPGVILAVMFTMYVQTIVISDRGWRQGISTALSLFDASAWFSTAFLAFAMGVILCIGQAILLTVVGMVFGVMLIFIPATEFYTELFHFMTFISSVIISMLGLAFSVSMGFQYFHLTEKVYGHGGSHLVDQIRKDI